MIRMWAKVMAEFVALIVWLVILTVGVEIVGDHVATQRLNAKSYQANKLCCELVSNLAK